MLAMHVYFVMIIELGLLIEAVLLHAGKIVEEVSTTTDEVEKSEDIVGDEEENVGTRVSHQIVFVTAEAAPYSKTGGLGDVCGSLPIALAARGHRVMVVSPRYVHGTSEDDKFARAVDLDRRIKVSCFGGLQEVAFYHEYREGVDWVRTFETYEFNPKCKLQTYT